MDLSVVRADLASALGGLGYSPYSALPGSPELPAAIVNAPSEIEYHFNAFGHCKLTIPITLLVSRADEESAQKALNTAVSFGIDGSVVSALEAATGTTWAQLVVEGATRFLPVVLSENTTALGADIIVTLIA